MAFEKAMQLLIMKQSFSCILNRRHEGVSDKHGECHEAPVKEGMEGMVDIADVVLNAASRLNLA